MDSFFSYYGADEVDFTFLLIKIDKGTRSEGCIFRNLFYRQSLKLRTQFAVAADANWAYVTQKCVLRAANLSGTVQRYKLY